MLEKANQIFEEMKDISYGWTDGSGTFYDNIGQDYILKFKMQTCKEIEKTRIGTCWEIAELGRNHLENSGIKCKTYLFSIPTGKFYCHSVLVFTDNNKYYWFENSSKNFKGIREYNSLDDLFYYILDNFKKIIEKDDINIKLIKIFEYTKPKDGIKCVPFYLRCLSSKNLTNLYLTKYLKSIVNENK